MAFPTPHGKQVLKTVLLGAHLWEREFWPSKTTASVRKIRFAREESSNPQPGPAPSIPYPYCNTHFRAKIVFFSHLRTHPDPIPPSESKSWSSSPAKDEHHVPALPIFHADNISTAFENISVHNLHFKILFFCFDTCLNKQVTVKVQYS